MSFSYVIIETDAGNKIAIIGTLEDSVGLGEKGVKLMVLRENAESLHRAVSRLKRAHYKKFGKRVDGIMSEWVPLLVSQGLLIKPSS
jgi:hypothetical protein